MPKKVTVFLADWFLRRFKTFLYILLFKDLDPPLSLWPILLHKDHDLIKLESTFLRMLQNKFQLFWSDGFGEDFFKKSNKFSKILVNLPLKEGMSFHFRSI